MNEYENMTLGELISHLKKFVAHSPYGETEEEVIIENEILSRFKKLENEDEIKSHVDDNKRHLGMIKRLMNQLEVLSVKLNHFMEEISKGEVLKGEAKGFVGESIIWTLREEYDKSKALWQECYNKYGESNHNQ